MPIKPRKGRIKPSAEISCCPMERGFFLVSMDRFQARRVRLRINRRSAARPQPRPKRKGTQKAQKAQKGTFFLCLFPIYPGYWGRGAGAGLVNFAASIGTFGCTSLSSVVACPLVQVTIHLK